MVQVDPVALIVALIGAGGVGSVLQVLVKGMMAHHAGRAEGERRATADLVHQRDDAYARLAAVTAESDRQLAAERLRTQAAEEGEAHARLHGRLALDYAAARRRQLREQCAVEPADYPTCERCGRPIDQTGA